jgi:ribonuclease P protein component
MISFIKKDKDFNRVIKNGKKLSSAIAYAKYIENKAKSLRIGVVVPKSLVSSAVQRNRLRRIFKEAIRSLEDHSSKAFDIVVFPTKLATKKTFWEAQGFFKHILG